MMEEEEIVHVRHIFGNEVKAMVVLHELQNFVVIHNCPCIACLDSGKFLVVGLVGPLVLKEVFTWWEIFWDILLVKRKIRLKTKLSGVGAMQVALALQKQTMSLLYLFPCYIHLSTIHQRPVSNLQYVWYKIIIHPDEVKDSSVLSGASFHDFL